MLGLFGAVGGAGTPPGGAEDDGATGAAGGPGGIGLDGAEGGGMKDVPAPVKDGAVGIGTACGGTCGTCGAGGSENVGAGTGTGTGKAVVGMNAALVR